MAGKKVQSHRDLEIWRTARELVVVVHKMTLEKLPKFEMYEERSQICRSSKWISSNILLPKTKLLNKYLLMKTNKHRASSNKHLNSEE